MNDNTCYICGNPNSMLNDYWIPQMDGTNTHYHESCLKAQNEMLATYGNIEVGQHMVWRDADDNQHEGSILCITPESDGCGHFLTLRNKEGGVDEVPISLVEGFYARGVWCDIDGDADDFTRVHNDIEVSIDPVTENRMVVACTNSNGEPDFAFVTVRCTDEQRDDGDDYEAAKKWASENDYEEPMVAFNCEVDPAGKAIVNHFCWESSSVIDA